MGKIQDLFVGIFIVVIVLLTWMSVLGVWEIVDKDVIAKSLQTLGLIAFVSIIVMVAAKYMGAGHVSVPTDVPQLPNPAFRTIRVGTLAVLIAAAGTLALIGILVIWDVIAESQVLWKSISSLLILCFGAFIIVVACLQKENSPLLQKKGISGGGVVLVIVMIWLTIWAISNSLSPYGGYY